MKKVLYVSNIEVPYRVKFFNELSKKCDLTVLYERKKSSNRNEKWTKSEKSNYKIEYLHGINIKNENSVDLKILKYIFSKKYDVIIFGCYNSPIQTFSIFLMKMFRKKYYLNMDGEVFADGNGIKNKIKKFFIRGAEKYLVAGEKSAQSLKNIVKCNEIYPYYFSSLNEKEIIENEKKANKNCKREDYILAVGQYYDYKGLDILLEVAKLEPHLNFKIVGTGNRTDLILKKIEEMNLKNVEVVDFLKKDELEKEYLKCKMLVLPSKKECWGLVINEAASLGCPIVSTYGSGAAVEFLSDSIYKCFLAKQIDYNDLNEKIINLYKYNCEDLIKYQNYLINKSKNYTIEKSVYNMENILI